jgi:hypothetical protein
MGVAVLLFLGGGLIYLLGRLGGGSLPGDIVVRRGNFTFIFPIVTMIVVSVVLTVVLNLFLRK